MTFHTLVETTSTPSPPQSILHTVARTIFLKPYLLGPLLIKTFQWAFAFMKNSSNSSTGDSMPLTMRSFSFSNRCLTVPSPSFLLPDVCPHYFCPRPSFSSSVLCEYRIIFHSLKVPRSCLFSFAHVISFT